jgi:putative hydrolase of the HAD superfamily
MPIRMSAVETREERTLCERFLGPIFAVGRIYEDTLPALERLRQAGYPTAIVSNAPWGSPPQLWRSELERMGLARAVDTVVMCGDVGWRKPAAQIFQHAAAELRTACEDCAFVGDELEWDVGGSSAVGMRAILLDREDLNPGHSGSRIRSLHELSSCIGSVTGRT